MTQQFHFTNTPLEGLKIVQRRATEDSRGFLSRAFCANEFAGHGFNKSVSQINQTLTYKKASVRGLHYQLMPYTEIKLVSCVKGEIFDVAVDIRKGSPTFLNWHSEVLSEKNQKSMLIPEGFAHGFQSLTDNCELIYLHSSPYKKDSEAALNINDPKLAITFPLSITDISKRDRSHPYIDDNFDGVSL
jgi:dTDP-4-dehydrorhamnose 3,5-epimerase